MRVIALFLLLLMMAGASSAIELGTQPWPDGENGTGTGGTTGGSGTTTTSCTVSVFCYSSGVLTGSVECTSVKNNCVRGLTSVFCDWVETKC